MSAKNAENYTAFSDEQLVSLIRTGNNECFTVLRDRYLKIIESIADKYSAVCARNDLVYTGAVGFADAVMSYRDDMGASFKTFAHACIKSNMIDLCKKANSSKYIPRDLLASIDDVDAVDYDDPESLIIKKEYFDLLFAAMKSKLSALEYKVFIKSASGKSYKEIAAEIGKNEKTVENALARARAKVKELKR